MGINYADIHGELEWLPYRPPEKIRDCAVSFAHYLDYMKMMGYNIALDELKKGYMSEDMFCDQLEPNVSLKEADAKPAESRDAYFLEKLVNYINGSLGTGKDGREKAPDAIIFPYNFEMLRGDGLQTRSYTPVDECGLRSIYGDSLEFISVEMLRMVNMSPFSAMKLKVKLGSREVVGLIDSGATRSFISPFLVAELNLPCDNSVRRELQLGNGECYTQEGICRKVDFQVQGIPFTDDFLPFKLGDVDVILGFTWLKTLGPVLTDWNNLTMEFKHRDSWVCLFGDPSLSCHPADLHAILAWEYLSVLVLGSISVLCSNQSPCNDKVVPP